MHHAHILLSVDPEDAPTTPEKIDRLVRATIPEQPTDDMSPEEAAFQRALYQAVAKHMIHSRCKNVAEAYCNQGKKPHWRTCCKRFPKDYAPYTTVGENNYAQLERPQGGRKVKKTAYGEKEVEHDCRWVVAYNPTLLVALDAHVNVEVSMASHCERKN